MIQSASSTEQRLTRRLEDRLDDMIAYASELISIPTENPPGNGYSECVALLKDQLRRLDLPVDRLQTSSDRTVLFSAVGKGPTLYLHGHYDVVPASDREQFKPALRNGRLFGRGSADMKAAIAAMMFTLDALRSEALSGRVELVLVPDEESGGKCGTERLLSLGRLGKAGIGAIIGEPTSGRIWNANRGAVTIRVNLSGRQAHVGLHFQGDNAFENAIPLLNALEMLKSEVGSRETVLDVATDAARRSILMLGGEVAGGNQFNTVPDRFSFTVDRRFNPEENLEAEKARLLEVINSAATGAAVRVEILQEGSSSACDPAAPVCRALSESILEATGCRPEFEMCPGLLESRFYAAAGVPAVAYGPGELELAHGPDENVEVRRVLECAEAYCLTAHKLLSEPL